MSPRTIRRIVWLVFVAGIAGMIVGSIRDSNGFAITAGLVTAMGALGLILITSVAPPGSLAKPRDGDAGGQEAAPTDATTTASRVDEAVARDVERRINDLVAEGADEDEVRLLVRRAIDLGKGM